MDEKDKKKEDTPLTLLLKSPQKNLQRPPRPETPSLAHLPNVSTFLPPVVPDAKPTITIHNTVSTLDTSTQLNLSTITCRTRNSEYNPARFRGLIMRILQPKSTALIFSSGKVVITGARSEKQALMAAKRFTRIIQRTSEHPEQVKMKDFNMRNVVGTCDVRFPIKLEALNQVHSQFSHYEPELFPAVIYRLIKPRVVLLIFVNGKLVLTGGKTQNELHEALDQMLPILKSFRKQ